MKKPTYEDVQNLFSKRGYILLEDQYINSKIKMKYICSIHPNKELYISYQHLKRGIGCPYCSGKGMPTYEEVFETFKNAGYELLEEEYINNKFKMKFRCPYHPDKEIKISYDRLKRGEGCAYCAGNIKHTIEEVRLEFEKAGYTLLESGYNNTLTLMRYLCPKHPDKENYIRLHDLKRGYRCADCYHDSKRLNYLDVVKEFEDNGYELLEEKYKNSNTKMRYKCLHHPDKVLHISHSQLKQGHGCPYCAGVAKYTMEEVTSEFEKHGYTLLETNYKDVATKLEFRCEIHPDFKQSIRLSNLMRGHGCKQCGKESSIINRTGENSALWKGGITKISEHLRRNLKEWKMESLAKYDYKCAITNLKSNDLEVHHIKPFSQIVSEVFEELKINIRPQIINYSQQELEEITGKIKERHEDAVGIPLRKDIHKLFHSIYGRTNTTIEDFIEFKSKFQSGEIKMA